MSDIEFDFLVRFAQSTPEIRDRLLSSPVHRKTVAGLGSIARELLNCLRGGKTSGHIADAWLALVVKAAEEDEPGVIS